MMQFMKRIALAMSTGIVFVVFSELMFWGRYDYHHKLISDLLPTWIAYSMMAYVFLWTVSYFRAKSVWAIFLAGAVFGWLDEGIVVQTMYKDFPVNISITGLSWHALLTVLVGWYLPRLRISRARPMPVLWPASMVGAVWALWAVWWWIAGKVVLSPQGFAIYSAITTALLTLGLLGCHVFRMPEFRPSRGETVFFALVILSYYCFVTVRANILSPIVLPPFMGLTLWALARNRQMESPGSAISLPVHGGMASCYLCLAAMPVTASAIYWALYTAGARLYTGPPFYAITGLAGFAMYLASIGKVVHASHRAGEAGGGQSPPGEHALAHGADTSGGC